MKLKIECLSAGYDKDFVIKDLSLSVNQGEFLSLLGPSGCGKTTLMKAVAGILPAQGGRILLDGEDITSPSPSTNAALSSSSRICAWFPHMTVEENVAFPLKMQGVSRSGRLEQARDLLEKVQMGGFLDRRPSELSGGQQQRGRPCQGPGGQTPAPAPGRALFCPGRKSQRGYAESCPSVTAGIPYDRGPGDP